MGLKITMCEADEVPVAPTTTYGKCRRAPINCRTPGAGGPRLTTDHRDHPDTHSTSESHLQSGVS